ncbi:MAG: TIGR00730 family Rossman fold protein [Bacteroidales bacterium]|nr:TIGR00730 family Rossman fold protein [Bacteroidales bacterium]
MEKICIFCGSSMGFDPIYREKAAELGQAMVERHCELLYGGGSVGLMKIIADVMLENKCKVTGTITNHLMDMEVGYNDIDELIVVDSMSERKKILEDMADGFIAMPGGLGTMDEFFEAFVLSQLRVFDKPVALYNVNGFYDDIIRFIDHAAKEGFIRKEHAYNLIVSDDPKELLEKMEQFQPTDVNKWVVEIKEQVKTENR